METVNELIKKRKQMGSNVDNLSKLSGLGSIDSAQTLNLSGLSTIKSGVRGEKNKDSHGFTFFPRPEMNMTTINIEQYLPFSYLLNEDKRSMARALRVMLDSELGNIDEFASDVFDNKQAFLPILTNNLVSISGFPDIALDTYTTPEGNYKESFSMVDSTAHIFNSFDITANFRNIQGDPITLIMYIWTNYQSLVYDGTLVARLDKRIYQQVDYTTRIYRFVMDEGDKYIQKYGNTGASFPLACPIGNALSYSNESTYNMNNDQISVPFKCMGMEYMEPGSLNDFNKTVVMYNVSMSDESREYTMVKISNSLPYGEDGVLIEAMLRNPLTVNYGFIGESLKRILDNKMYPRVEMLTMELEWYATVTDYKIAIIELRAIGWV